MNSKDNIEDKLKKVFCLVFSLDSIDNSFSKNSSAKWDSMQSLNLIISVEEEFDVYFNEDEIPNLDSFVSVLELLKTKIS